MKYLYDHPALCFLVVAIIALIVFFVNQNADSLGIVVIMTFFLLGTLIAFFFLYNNERKHDHPQIRE